MLTIVKTNYISTMYQLGGAQQRTIPGQTHRQELRSAGHGGQNRDAEALAPDGRSGFIRIDRVHHGDLHGVKGVLHINAFDCVPQWDVVKTKWGLT